MELYKITFTKKGYITDVLYNNSDDENEAIESAINHTVNEWDSVRARCVSEETTEE